MIFQKEEQRSRGLVSGEMNMWVGWLQWGVKALKKKDV
jgi:hypothetical protein